MSQPSRSVFAALERWEKKALISSELAQRLRSEVVEAAEAGTARLSQFLVAGAGAVVLIIAGGVFVDWAWPQMEAASRTLFLLVVGLVVHMWGAQLEGRHRWVPASLLMQTAGLGMLMTAFVYSKNAWEDLTPAGIAMGVGALATPFLLAPRTLRANVIMPAVHLCFALGFVAVFLDRTTSLRGDDIIWVLDAVLLGCTLGMVWLMRRDPDGTRHPWALNAFVMALYAGGVLIFATGAGPMRMGADVAYALDVWLLVVAAVTLWGIHRSPVGLRRDWFESMLAWCMLLWIPLGGFTAMEAMDGPSELVLALVGSVAVAGFAYALRFRTRSMLFASAVAFVAAAWIWAADRGGALGVVGGLALAAAVLFSVSGRVGAWASPDAGAAQDPPGPRPAGG